MRHDFEVGERVEIVADESGHQLGAQGTIVFVKRLFIYVELDEPPQEELRIILLDPTTNQPRILSSFMPEQLRHITTPSA